MKTLLTVLAATALLTACGTEEDYTSAPAPTRINNDPLMMDLLPVTNQSSFYPRYQHSKMKMSLIQRVSSGEPSVLSNYN